MYYYYTILTKGKFITAKTKERLVIKNMRQHVGKHILTTLSIAGINTCGFCGQSNTCTIRLDHNPNTHIETPTSPNCPYFYKFSMLANRKKYAAFNNGIIAKNAPCTNRPELCSIC